MSLVDFRLYLITDRKLFSSYGSFERAVKEALEAGVRVIQLREKDLLTRALLDMAYKFRELTAKCGAKLIISDRLDIALSVGADGVHLGQSGIPVGAVRAVVKESLLIGCSTHSFKEALEAESGGADFVTFGPLFRTPAKLKYGEPVGLEALSEVSKRISLPIFGIGGIKLKNVNDVLKAGASGVALISGILSETIGADTASATREYLARAGEQQ